MEPINYTSAFADLPSPNAAIMQGIKDGAGIQALQVQQQQAQLAQQQKMQMNADLAELANNPTTEAIGKMSIKYPALSENFKRSFDILDPAQRQSKLDHAAQVYAALHNGQPDIAQKILKDQAEAYRNAGNEKDAHGSETFAEMIRIHPEMAKTTGGLMLSAAMGPDKFASAFGDIGEEGRAAQQGPADLAKKQADAKKAAAEAAVAVGTVPEQIQKATEDNLSAQTKRRIDELEVQIKQANSETDRGRLILERDKLVAEQAKQGTEKGDTAQAQIDSAQHALNTIKSLRSDPAAKDSTGNWVMGPGTVLGKILSFVPGTENMDYKAQLESLKSQVFLPAVQQVKGMGALSNAEGEKLTAAIAGLNADMSPRARDNAIGVIERYMEKALQKGLANKAVPVQGGGLVVNHPTLGPVREGDINRLMKQFPGSTRDQVIEYLDKTTPGGK